MSDDIQNEQPTDSWRESIPEALREAPYFRKAESVDQVLADLNNAAQLQGDLSKSHIKLPTDEDGVPDFLEKIKDYLPDNDESWHEAPDEETLAAQAAEVEAQEAEAAQQEADRVEAWQKEQYLALKDEFGHDLDEKYQQIEALLGGAPESLQQAYLTKQLDADAMKWLATIADKMDEPAGEIRNQIGTPKETRSPQERYRELAGQLNGLRQGDAQYDKVLNKMNAVLTGRT